MNGRRYLSQGTDGAKGCESCWEKYRGLGVLPHSRSIRFSQGKWLWITMPGIHVRHRSWCMPAELETQRILGDHKMESPNSSLSLIWYFLTLRVFRITQKPQYHYLEVAQGRWSPGCFASLVILPDFNWRTSFGGHGLFPWHVYASWVLSI